MHFPLFILLLLAVTFELMDCSQQLHFLFLYLGRNLFFQDWSSIFHGYNHTTIAYLSHSCFIICTNPSNLFSWSPGSNATTDFRSLTNSVCVKVFSIYATSLLLCSSIVRSTCLHWCWDNITGKWHLPPLHQGLKGLYHIKAQSKSVHIAYVWMTNSTFGVKFSALPLYETQESFRHHTLNQICTLYRSRCFLTWCLLLAFMSL